MTITTQSPGPHGYVVVRHVDPTVAYPLSEVARRQPPGHLDGSEVARRYRGFDGDLWPGAEFNVIAKNQFGLADRHQLRLLQHTAANCDSPELCDLIYLSTGKGCQLCRTADHLLLGYDFGHFASVYDKYSVILNEVIFGRHDEIRQFARQLNDHLLLPTVETARFLGAARTHLLAHGGDLETDINPIPMCVFGVSRQHEG